MTRIVNTLKSMSASMESTKTIKTNLINLTVTKIMPMNLRIVRDRKWAPKAWSRTRKTKT